MVIRQATCVWARQDDCFAFLACSASFLRMVWSSRGFFLSRLPISRLVVVDCAHTSGSRCGNDQLLLMIVATVTFPVRPAFLFSSLFTAVLQYGATKGEAAVWLPRHEKSLPLLGLIMFQPIPDFYFEKTIYYYGWSHLPVEVMADT